jgi:ABC-type Fe2+-enterobactin transport system substrate-binding protein
LLCKFNLCRCYTKAEKEALIEKAQTEQQRLIAQGGVPLESTPNAAKSKKTKASKVGRCTLTPPDP